MNVRTDINSVLMQMRDMQVQAQGQINKPAELAQGADKAAAPGFGEMLNQASVSFQAMTQVRNRLVAAYEDVMKMPI